MTVPRMKDFFGLNLASGCIVILILDLMYLLYKILLALQFKDENNNTLPVVLEILSSGIGIFMIWLAFIGSVQKSSRLIFPYLLYQPALLIYGLVSKLAVSFEVSEYRITIKDRMLSTLGAYLFMGFHYISVFLVVCCHYIEIKEKKTYASKNILLALDMENCIKK